MARQSALALIRRILPFARPHRRWAIAMVVAMVVESPLTMIMPLILRHVVDTAVSDANRQGVYRWGLILLSITLGSIALRLLIDYCSLIFRHKVYYQLRRRLFQRLQSLPLGYHSQHETGFLMSRQLDDVVSLSGVMADTFGRGTIAAAKALTCMVMLFYVQWRLAFAGLLIAGVVFGFQYAISGQLRRRNRTARDAWTRLNSTLHQSISGHYLVQATASERREARRFANALHGAVRAMVRRDVFGVFTSNVIALFSAMIPTLIILSGVVLIVTSGFTVGGLFAFYIYLDLMFNSVSQLAGMNPALQTALAALERICEVLDTEPSLESPPHALHPGRLRGDVRFEDLSFAYHPDREVLRHIDFHAPPRAMVALVGPSGAGKTTLAHLVPRFYDPTAGTLRIDGHDLRDLDLGSLRRQIGIVPQEIFLFDRTIGENIAYGRPRATLEEIRAAAKAANALDFIERMEQGFETPIGERGVRLSGGQRQRVAIAREILRDPAVLILDEATSALDSESEALIQQALETLLVGRTSFVIAHRLSTVLRADVILVLENGEIVERGRHADLLAKNGLYARLYEAQFKANGKGAKERDVENGRDG